MGKYVDRKYIYTRDQQRCMFCHKPLKLGNMSLDHYYPKSKGGTYDVFNLVASCKRCNRWKKNRIPEDWEECVVDLIDRAVQDSRLTSTLPRIKHRELLTWFQGIRNLKFFKNEVIIETHERRLYINENKIIKMEEI